MLTTVFGLCVIHYGFILHRVCIEKGLVLLRNFGSVILEQLFTLVLVEDFQVLWHDEDIEPLLVLAEHLKLVKRHNWLENFVDERVVERILGQELFVGCRAA